MTLKRDVAGIDADSSLIGEVVLGAGATVVRSTIHGPAIIGAGTRIVDAYVGPFTAIDAAANSPPARSSSRSSSSAASSAMSVSHRRLADRARDVTIESSR